MDDHDRIAELEARVKTLTHHLSVVQRHLQTQVPASDSQEGTVEGPSRPKQLLDKVTTKAEKALGGEEGESIEARIGGIWLNRFAVLAIMTFIALAAQVTEQSPALRSLDKLLIGGGAALIAIFYGVVRRENERAFPQTILGCGLALLYYTTYCVFYHPNLAVIHDNRFALASVGAVLALCFGIAHWRRSQATAGITLFLIFYSVVLSSLHEATQETLLYALFTLAIVAIAAVVFHALNRWLYFTWAALIATQLTYIYFFLGRPQGLEMDEAAYFWLSNGFLTIIYVAFTLACILDGYKTNEYRKSVAQLSGVNSFVFFTLTWWAIRFSPYVADEWMFRLSFAAGLLLFTILSRILGPKHNYLFQIFAAKTVVMATLALQAYLSHEWLLLAIAIEALALGFSYRRAGIVVFKLMGLGLTLIAFVGALFSARVSGTVEIGQYVLPANWFVTIGVPVIFSILACFYENFVPLFPPEKRVAKGQWFLADGFLDIRPSAMALLHASCAAFILLTTTVLNLGDDPRLPYILAVEAVACASIGLLLRTQAIEVGCVLLLVAAHVCYHAFLFMPQPGFIDQPFFPTYTVLVALFTFFGAYIWEHYLYRIKDEAQWEHDLVASGPYIISALMLTTLMPYVLTGPLAPLAMMGIGSGILLTGCAFHYTGVGLSGLLAIYMGAYSLYQGIYSLDDAHTAYASFPGSLLGMMGLLAGAERLLVLIRRFRKDTGASDDLARASLVLIAVLIGLVGTYEWTLQLPEDMEGWLTHRWLTIHWIILGIGGIILGALFRASMYRWASLVILLFASARAFFSDLKQDSLVMATLVFAALGGTLLIISYAYDRRRSTTFATKEDTIHDDSHPSS